MLRDEAHTDKEHQGKRETESLTGGVLKEAASFLLFCFAWLLRLTRRINLTKLRLGLGKSLKTSLS